MKNFLMATVALAALASPASAKTLAELFASHPLSSEERAFFGEFDFQQGEVEIRAAKAHLSVPDGFYYLDPERTRKVLTDVWGNPPSAAADNLGMLFPVAYLPSDEKAWGSVIEYDADGYVSDVDAASVDYDDLLKQIKEGVAENNSEREKQGFEPITLVGWASPPHYDAAAHALHWARDLIFGKGPDQPHTLNYSVRMLGRDGVLQMNFVAGLDQLPEIKAAIPAAISMVSFDKGAGYVDYRDGDKIAAYGMAGMIAAGAGAKVAAKLGLFATIAAILKKGGIFAALAGFGGIYRFFGKLFKRDKAPSA